MKSRNYDSLFKGRNLPSFVKDFILRRYTDDNGAVNGPAVEAYLASKMPSDAEMMKQCLLGGDSVNITTRFSVNTDMAKGMVRFTLPEINLSADAFVSQEVLENDGEPITDGEHWGNITLVYVEPEGRRKGYVLMTTYKAFEPYRIDVP